MATRHAAGPLYAILALALALPVPVLAVEDPGVILSEEHEDAANFHIDSDDGNWLLVPGGFVQLRYQLGYEDYFPWDTNSTFHVPRAKLFALGHAFSPTLRYKLQINLGGTAVGEEQVLEDAFVEWAPGPSLGVRAGQFRAPYSRQRLTSTTRLVFVERALEHVIDEYDRNLYRFNLGRQAGVMLFGDSETFEYRLAVLNGNGARPFGDWDNPRPLFVARVAVSPFGPVPYEEGCVNEDYWDDTLLAIGLNAFHQMHEAMDVSGLGADLALRYGRLGADLEVHFKLRHGKSTYGSFGGHADVSLFLDELGLLVGARYAIVLEDLGNLELRRHQVGPAVAYLPWGHHNAKLMADLLLLAEELPTLHLSPALRVQVVLRF